MFVKYNIKIMFHKYHIKTMSVKYIRTMFDMHKLFNS